LAGYGSAPLLTGAVAGHCRALCAGAVVLGEFCRANRPCGALQRLRRRWWWGVYAMRSPLTACRRRVGALDGV